MARKSRRGNGNNKQVGVDAKKQLESSAGVYLRLSSKDKAVKDSIYNQRLIIESYLESKPDLSVFKYYVDETALVKRKLNYFILYLRGEQTFAQRDGKTSRVTHLIVIMILIINIMLRPWHITHVSQYFTIIILLFVISSC